MNFWQFVFAIVVVSSLTTIITKWITSRQPHDACDPHAREKIKSLESDLESLQQALDKAEQQILALETIVIEK